MHHPHTLEILQYIYNSLSLPSCLVLLVAVLSCSAGAVDIVEFKIVSLLRTGTELIVKGKF